MLKATRITSTTKAKHYLEWLRISDQLSNTLIGSTPQFFGINYSMRAHTGVRIRIFSSVEMSRFSAAEDTMIKIQPKTIDISTRLLR